MTIFRASDSVSDRSVLVHFLRHGAFVNAGFLVFVLLAVATPEHY
jgi:hypothetical protein